MAVDLSPVEAVVEAGLGRVFPAAQLEVRLGGQAVLSRSYGYLRSEARGLPTRADTLFDLASLTKLFVATAFMALVERRVVALDQPVGVALPELASPRPILPTVEAPAAGEGDAEPVTFRHLLTHSAGLPAWLPLYQAPSATGALRMALYSHWAYRTGTRVIYSDLGPILLGLAVERLTRRPLDRALARLVAGPAGLRRTRYRPLAGRAPEVGNVAPTGVCPWRRRRIVGEVHDENAARLGGVAGHAGLFSTAADVAALGQLYLDGGRPLLSPETVAEMTRLQAEDGATRRGLAFALWSPDPEAAGHPFGARAFGHTGFTGTSLWVDPDRALVVACLTNRVYYGRQPEGIQAFRVALHQAIVAAVDQGTIGGD